MDLIRDQLFFGRLIPGGGEVTDADWSAFEAAEILPRFAAGFTVMKGEGVWRDAASGAAVREPSIVLDVLHPADKGGEVEAIAKAYKQRFRQDAVLRASAPVSVNFI